MKIDFTPLHSNGNQTTQKIEILMIDNRIKQNRLEILTDTIHPPTKMSFTDFMRAHRIAGDSQLPITHTRIGRASNNQDEVIYGGKYHIPDDKRSTFMKLYYDKI
jgi:hypothetical protein